MELKVDAAAFEKMHENAQVKLFTLTNKNGITVQLTNYGAHIVSVLTPDKNNNIDDIILGYGHLEGYLNDPMFLGSVVGRFANRIEDGKFTLEGKEYQITLNEGTKALHGGKKGFDKIVWDAEQQGNKVIFTLTSPDGDQGFPGEMKLTHTIELTEANELILEYFATTDKTTVINMTNHAYWNLLGEGKGPITEHEIQINASKITPVKENLIPTGELMEVEGSVFDFRTVKAIGKDINQEDIQLKHAGGYDHNWVLDVEKPGELVKAIHLEESTTGRVLELWTNVPGIQVYAGNFMDGTVKGKAGLPYEFRSGVALEPQHFPDSPNQPNFPSTVLKPGEKYFQKSVYKFYTK